MTLLSLPLSIWTIRAKSEEKDELLSGTKADECRSTAKKCLILAILHRSLIDTYASDYNGTIWTIKHLHIHLFMLQWTLSQRRLITFTNTSARIHINRDTIDDFHSSIQENFNSKQIIKTKFQLDVSRESFFVCSTRWWWWWWSNPHVLSAL